MRILVTGAAGFIGSHVLTAMLDAGHEVIALDGLLPPVHSEAAWPDFVDERAERFIGDLRDPEVVDDALAGVGAVVHQAALVGHGLDLQDLPLYAGLTDLGTAQLLAGMARAQVSSLVLASSMVVYGEGAYACREHGPTVPRPREAADLEAGLFEPRCPSCGAFLDWTLVSEDAEKNPQSVYATSKLAQEHYAAAWSRGTGGRAYFLRYHNVYGPRMPLDSAYSGVAAIFRSRLAAGEAPLVFEDGGQMRDFVHVSDVARANLLALDTIEAAPEGGLPINICSGQPRSVGWAAQLLSTELAGPSPVTTGQFRAADVRHVVASPARARDSIGFETTVSPEDGFARFATEPTAQSSGNG